MTDKDIIDVLEKITKIESKHDAKNDTIYFMKGIFDLIKRQQAEIEKLKSSRDRWKQLAKDFDESSRENEKEIETLHTEIADLKNQLTFRILERRV